MQRSLFNGVGSDKEGLISSMRILVEKQAGLRKCSTSPLSDIRGHMTLYDVNTMMFRLHIMPVDI